MGAIIILPGEKLPNEKAEIPYLLAHNYDAKEVSIRTVIINFIDS
jgi:hypothetical protein